MKKLLAVLIATALIVAPIPALAGKRPPKPPASPTHRTEFDLDGFRVISENPRFVKPGAPTTRLTRFESPWGETMVVDTRVENDVVQITIDDVVVVRYLVDDAGKALAMQVEADGRKEGTLVGDRALRAAHGMLRGEEFDTAPYQLLASSLRGLHSQEFYDGLYAGGRGAALPACSCWGPMAGCALAITAWVLDIIGLIGGCTGGLPPLCIAAIIAHELASAAVLAACVEYLQCLDNK